MKKERLLELAGIPLTEADEQMNLALDSPVDLWGFVKKANWTKDHDYNRVGKILKAMPSEEAKAIEHEYHQAEKKLTKAIWDVTGVGDDAHTDLTAHIIGMGKAAYNRAMKDLSFAQDIVDNDQYEENFGYSFQALHENDVLDPDKAERYREQTRKVMSDNEARRQQRRDSLTSTSRRDIRRRRRGTGYKNPSPFSVEFEEENEEGSIPETRIGGHDIKLLVVGRDKNPFGNNAIAGIEFNGSNYNVYKQGMINIWAFPKRMTMSSEEQDQFDKWMDENYDKAPSAPSE